MLTFGRNSSKPSRLLTKESNANMIDINGEKFNLERDDGLIWLSHPEWSFVGFGKTVLDAETKIGYECAVLLSEFPDMLRHSSRLWRFAADTAIWNYIDENGNCKCCACEEQ